MLIIYMIILLTQVYKHDVRNTISKTQHHYFMEVTLQSEKHILHHAFLSRRYENNSEGLTTAFEAPCMQNQNRPLLIGHTKYACHPPG